jgi:ATP-binding cassette subfamily B protein
MQDWRSSRLRHIVAGHLRESAAGLTFAGACLVGYTAMELVAPWPMKIIIDNILLNKPARGLLAPWNDFLHAEKALALVAVSSSIVFISLLRGALDYGQLYVTSRIGHHLVYKLRRELFLHLQRLSLTYHNRARSGELLTKVTSDTKALKDVFAESALDFAGQVAVMLAMLGAMVVLNWRLGLVVLALFPVLCHSFFVTYRKVKASAKRQREREGRVASRISEVLNSVSLVQAFSRERYEQERFDSESTRTLEESVRTARMEAVASRRVEFISAVGRSVTVLLASLQVLSGRMTPGDIIVFVTYLTGMYKPMRNLAKLAGQFSKAAVSAERVAMILDAEPEIPDRSGAVAAIALRGDIEFCNVCFSYGSGRTVLSDLSFRIDAGRRVALVGASGAGKSTIVSLILRLYDPSAGGIAIDGVDLRDYQRESLRREIGVVLQDAVLFGASIRENITYGKPEASQEEIEAAASEAHIHEFIIGLPSGYDTILGERGCTLSGGQRQRLCLARAMIRRPSILILDEPTSSVDAQSAVLIRDAVNRLQRGKTLLMIAHQFVGMEHFDSILVLKHGVLIEKGNHSELLAANGHYADLFQLQAVKPNFDVFAIAGERGKNK